MDDEEDDDLEEESLLETPLDKVEPYGMFKHALLRMSPPNIYTHELHSHAIGLQQEQPALYENLTKNLNPEEQQVVQGAVHQADIYAQAQAQAQAMMAANGGAAPAPQ